MVITIIRRIFWKDDDYDEDEDDNIDVDVIYYTNKNVVHVT